MNIKIVIVEDEVDLLELLEYNLTKEGYEVIGFLDTKNVKQHLQEERVHLLIMDRNLPIVEGSKFIASLRKDAIDIPVIFLSAKDKDEEIEEGFLRGGDDYLTKPFNMKELILRVKALIKRTTHKHNEGILQHRDLCINKATRELRVAGELVAITKLEFELLQELMINKDSVLEREYLLDNVWGQEDVYQYKTVTVAITRLKEKIDPTKTKNYIKTIRGVGYKLC